MQIYPKRQYPHSQPSKLWTHRIKKSVFRRSRLTPADISFSTAYPNSYPRRAFSLHFYTAPSTSHGAKRSIEA